MCERERDGEGKEEDREKEWPSALHCGWTHIWWPCVTGAAGLMMGFLRPAQLGQASPDSQRERGRKRDDYRHAGLPFVCVCVYESISTIYIPLLLTCVYRQACLSSTDVRFQAFVYM